MLQQFPLLADAPTPIVETPTSPTHAESMLQPDCLQLVESQQQLDGSQSTATAEEQVASPALAYNAGPTNVGTTNANGTPARTSTDAVAYAYAAVEGADATIVKVAAPQRLADEDMSAVKMASDLATMMKTRKKEKDTAAAMKRPAAAGPEDCTDGVVMQRPAAALGREVYPGVTELTARLTSNAPADSVVLKRPAAAPCTPSGAPCTPSGTQAECSSDEEHTAPADSVVLKRPAAAPCTPSGAPCTPSGTQA